MWDSVRSQAYFEGADGIGQQLPEQQGGNISALKIQQVPVRFVFYKQDNKTSLHVGGMSCCFLRRPVLLAV